MNFPLCLFQNSTTSPQFLLLLLNSLHSLQLHLREDRNLSFVGLFFFNNFVEFLFFPSQYLTQCRLVLTCCHQIFPISMGVMQIVLHAVFNLTEGNTTQSTLGVNSQICLPLWEERISSIIISPLNSAEDFPFMKGGKSTVN